MENPFVVIFPTSYTYILIMFSISHSCSVHRWGAVSRLPLQHKKWTFHNKRLWITIKKKGSDDDDVHCPFMAARPAFNLT